MDWFRSRRGAVVLSAAAFLAFLERALLDWRYVFPEFVPKTDTVTAAVSVAFYVACAAAWLWALSAASRGSRGGLRALLVLALLFGVVMGVATPTALCRFPCQTAWPLMEVSNWVGLVIGVLAAAAATIRLRSPGE